MLEEKEHRFIAEILRDATNRPGRLSDWEVSFLASLKGRLDRYGLETSMTENQWMALSKIEQKLYGG